MLKYTYKIKVDKFISVLKDLKDITISEKEKKFLLKIIHNQYKITHKKIRKIRRFFNILEIGTGFSTEMPPTIEEINLIERGLLLKIESNGLSNEQLRYFNKKLIDQKYKITSIGLIHILNKRYIYSPDFLIRYEDDVILQKILYPFFQPITIKSSTAKFYNIIVDYLFTVSEYLINLSKDLQKSISENQLEEIEQNIKIFSLILGYKIAIMFNDSNLLISNNEIKDEKAILAMYDIENNMKKNLAKDKKFLNLLSKVNNEFNSGYSEIMNFHK